MPLSHLTLTVSHLPTSTSFFLSCLQPLGYQFVGRHDEYIGFGSVPDEPADLWLAQERPGTPAGAAHVAFPAPSKEAVDEFFVLALKAGGKIHGEPKLRDSASGYYSAAVIDFDGNSIEAVHRPNSLSASKSQAGTHSLKVIQNGSVVSRARSTKAESVTSSSHKHETRSVALTAKALSAVEEAHRNAASMSHYATAPVPVAQQPIYAPVAPEQSDKGGKAAKAIIGTLLGATAGAAIAYAMVKGDSTPAQPSPPSVPINTVQYPPQTSIPAIMPVSIPGSIPAVSQVQQVIYKALEAPPARSFHSDHSREEVYSHYSQSISYKNPRADTLYEETEYRKSVGPRDIVYPEDSHGMRRSSEGTLYTDLPIRAIEYSPPKSRAMSYPYQASTLISSYVDKDRNREVDDYGSVREGGRDGDRGSEHSASTVKPIRSSNTHVSSHRSTTSSSHHSSPKRYHANPPSQAPSHRSSAIPRDHVLEEIEEGAPSKVSSARTVRNNGLADGSPSEHSNHTHKSKNTVVSATSKMSSKSNRSARNVPLPESVAASTVFLDVVDRPDGVDIGGVVHQGELSENDEEVTPEDSISQVGTSVKSSARSHHHHGSSHHHSHRSSHLSTTSKKSNGSTKSRRSSKFDEPVKPSDSISQVSVNTASKHTSSKVGSRHSRVV